jgi:enoyl-CoA hydratase
MTERPSFPIEMRGAIAVARMAYRKANALDTSFCHTLLDGLEALAAGPARAVVLTADGSIFSAGVDLIRLLDGGAEYRAAFVPLLSTLVRALFTFPKPLVAAVNGHAIAGGCVIACTADHRIMARGPARIGVPELLVGVPFPTAALEVVRFVVPAHQVQAVVYGGATCAPDDALAVGLVDELADAHSLLDHAIEAARRLGELPARAFVLTKRQLRGPTLARIEAGAARDVEVEKEWSDAETLRRVRGYVERTLRRRG